MTSTYIYIHFVHDNVVNNYINYCYDAHTDEQRNEWALIIFDAVKVFQNTKKQNRQMITWCVTWLKPPMVNDYITAVAAQGLLRPVLWLVLQGFP